MYKFILKILPVKTRYFLKRIGSKSFVKLYIFQRIFRINSHVPWPCHWTSIVLHVDRITLESFPPFPGYGIAQYIQAINGIHIGKNVRLGPRISLISADHDLDNYENHIKSEPIIIGENCWIGANAIILPGVSLGPHTIVAAGAVVTKSFPEGNIIISGIPASKTKEINDYNGNFDHLLQNI